MARLLDEKRKDRLAAVVIRVGGLLVILVVIAIVVNIGLQALPLFLGARQGAVEDLGPGADILAVGTDPRQHLPWALTRAGEILFPAHPERPPLEVLGEGVAVRSADLEVHELLTVLGDDGRLVVGRVRFTDRWDADERTTSARWRPAAEPLELGPGDWVGATVNGDTGGGLLAVAWDVEGRLAAARWRPDDEVWSAEEAPSGVDGVVAAAVGEEQLTVAVVDRRGRLRVFRQPGWQELEVEGLAGPTATARWLIGGGTLVAAAEGGALDVLLLVPRVEVTNRGERPLRTAGVRIPPGGSAVLLDDQVGASLASQPDVAVTAADPVVEVVRRLPPVDGRPTTIAPSHRRRGFLVGSDSGSVALYFSTTGRRLLMDRWGDGPVRALAMAPKADGGLAVVGPAMLRRTIDNPHPEASLRSLFLPVWYEGYAAPKWVWQSTGGSDAFEAKLSLWPLLFGTLKATLYAMLLSVPLALMSAVYVSQLAPPWVQTTVKPTLELMAAVPSVVVGFLAALWLAPRLEAALLPSIVAFASLPLAVVTAVATWRLTHAAWRRRLPAGGELVLLLGAAVAVGWAAFAVAGPLESWLFNGDFQRFLFTELGIRYDQRNAMVVGVALGFAVIPVIFTIAEDACSAVPQSLISAARALGATRWQTAVRLVVPAASPGLFAAVMLGLGRAVGETMIVLMAAGNTPLLDLSAFNGMRTMAAAIAVEIPEAPVGGTLFRVLFLTGTLLFLLTFVLTTAADGIGRHLRRRYGRF